MRIIRFCFSLGSTRFMKVARARGTDGYSLYKVFVFRSVNFQKKKSRFSRSQLSGPNQRGSVPEAADQDKELSSQCSQLLLGAEGVCPPEECSACQAVSKIHALRPNEYKTFLSSGRANLASFLLCFFLINQNLSFRISIFLCN